MKQTLGVCRGWQVGPPEASPWVVGRSRGASHEMEGAHHGDPYFAEPELLPRDPLRLMLLHRTGSCSRSRGHRVSNQKPAITHSDDLSVCMVPSPPLIWGPQAAAWAGESCQLGTVGFPGWSLPRGSDTCHSSDLGRGEDDTTFLKPTSTSPLSPSPCRHTQTPWHLSTATFYQCSPADGLVWPDETFAFMASLRPLADSQITVAMCSPW